MVLQLNNDTSAVNAATILTALYQEKIRMASLNYKYKFAAIPNDSEYNKQLSLRKSISPFDVETAWDYETTKNDDHIRIGVIDDGIDDNHCQFDGKVIGGYNYVDNSDEYYFLAKHGTNVAAIIGARTNYNCGSSNSGIAGIAGGWGNDPGADLVALKVGSSNGTVNSDLVISAIRDASFKNPNSSGWQGDACHVLNFSLQHFEHEVLDPPLEYALYYAYENNVVFVAARGNDGNNDNDIPATLSSQIVVSVGAHGSNQFKTNYSSYGKQMDF
jgi:hypothetical protein